VIPREFEYTLTASDVVAQYEFRHPNAATSNAQGQRQFRLFLQTGGAMLVFLVVAVVFAVPSLAARGVALGITAGIGVIGTLIAMRGTKPIGYAPPIVEPVGTTTLAASLDGLTSTSTHTVTHYGWAAFERLDETPEHVFLGSLIIPKRAFTDPIHQASFVAFVVAHMNDPGAH
jgi:YcxB-like protein